VSWPGKGGRRASARCILTIVFDSSAAEHPSCPRGNVLPLSTLSAMEQHLQWHLQIVPAVAKDNIFSCHKSMLRETEEPQPNYKPWISLGQGPPVADLGQRDAPQPLQHLSRQLRGCKQEQHCRGVTDLGSKNRPILMNMKQRVIFRQVLYLPGNTASPGHLHKAQLAEGWEEKCRSVLDESISEVQVTITCFDQQPAVCCWSSTDFALDTEAYKDQITCMIIQNQVCRSF